MGRRKRQPSAFNAEALPLGQRRIAEDVRDLIYLSTSLVRDFHVGAGSGATASRLARRMLGHLTNNGILKCFSMRKNKGAPENVYALAETKVPRDLLFLPHRLAVNRFTMNLRSACVLPREDEYSFDFLLEHDLFRKRTARDDDKRPDLVFTVASSQGRGIYLAELDLANEPLRSTDRKRASICRKLEWYAGLPDDELDRYREAFGYNFRGFRAIVVTTRPASIIRTCGQVNTGDVVGVADLKDIRPETAMDKAIWTVPGMGTAKKFRINWHPDGLESS